ncbi:hypothetical protein KY337_04065 [Candidatus Woesearchaeota archaeon]|nr:hypothetical protein [Candidatus Woesearchaeota archaeon]
MVDDKIDGLEHDRDSWTIFWTNVSAHYETQGAKTIEIYPHFKSYIKEQGITITPDNIPETEEFCAGLDSYLLEKGYTNGNGWTSEILGWTEDEKQRRIVGAKVKTVIDDLLKKIENFDKQDEPTKAAVAGAIIAGGFGSNTLKQAIIAKDIKNAEVYTRSGLNQGMYQALIQEIVEMPSAQMQTSKQYGDLLEMLRQNHCRDVVKPHTKEVIEKTVFEVLNEKREAYLQLKETQEARQEGTVDRKRLDDKADQNLAETKGVRQVASTIKSYLDAVINWGRENKKNLAYGTIGVVLLGGLGIAGIVYKSHNAAKQAEKARIEASETRKTVNNTAKKVEVVQKEADAARKETKQRHSLAQMLDVYYNDAKKAKGFDDVASMYLMGHEVEDSKSFVSAAATIGTSDQALIQDNVPKFKEVTQRRASYIARSLFDKAVEFEPDNLSLNKLLVNYKHLHPKRKVTYIGDALYALAQNQQFKAKMPEELKPLFGNIERTVSEAKKSGFNRRRSTLQLIRKFVADINNESRLQGKALDKALKNEWVWKVDSITPFTEIWYKRLDELEKEAEGDNSKEDVRQLLFKTK